MVGYGYGYRLGAHRRSEPAVPSDLHVDTQWFLDRLSVRPGDEDIARLDALMVETAEARHMLDALYLLAAWSEEASLLNLCSESYTLTPVGGPSFTPYRGWQGSGSNYLDSGYVPSEGLGWFSQWSSSLFHWPLTSTGGNSRDIGATGAYIGRRSLGGINFSPMSTPSVNDISVIYPGLIGWNREDATHRIVYRNAIAEAQGEEIAGSLPTLSFRICAVNGVGFGTQREAMGGWGSALPDEYWQDIYDAFNAYLSAVGAPV